MMKWPAFAILATITFVLQTTLVPHLAIGGVRPDWMFIVAVHYALWAPWPNAGIATWVLGLVVGLGTSEPDRMVLHAFCYAIAAWAIFRVRHGLFRDHPITQVVVTLVSGVLAHTLINLYRWWRTPGMTWEAVWLPALFTALYTAAWAPYLHWPLLRLGRWTGLRPTRGPASYRT